LLAVENLLAAQASKSQLRNSPSVLMAPNHDLNDDLQNRPSASADGPPSKRTRIEGSDTPNVDANSGETFVSLKLGQLEDESSAQDTVLDGMGALNLGDEEDYGYFGNRNRPIHLSVVLNISLPRPVIKYSFHRARHSRPSNIRERYHNFH